MIIHSLLKYFMNSCLVLNTMELRHRELTVVDGQSRSKRERPCARSKYLLCVSKDNSVVLAYVLKQMRDFGLTCEETTFEQNIHVIISASVEALGKQAETHKFLKPLKNSEEVIEYDHQKASEFSTLDGVHVFTAAEELYLLHCMIQATPFDHNEIRKHGFKVKEGEAFLSTLQKCQPRLLQDAYPLHDEEAYMHLKRKFLSTLLPLGLPINDIRNYFGENVTYYFAWMEFYTTCVLIPAILGITMYIFHHGDINVLKDAYLPLLSFFVCIWGVLYLIFWQRQSAIHSFTWNTYNYEKHEEPMDGFHGETRPDPVTGKPVTYYPHWKRRLWYVFSVVAMLPLLAVGIVVMSLSLNLNGYVTDVQSPIYIVALARYSEPGGLFAADHPYFGWLIPVIGHSVIIAILNNIYGTVAQKCTDLENHPTRERWYSSLVTKRVVFLSIAYFMPLFYTAFYQLDVVVLKAEIASLFMSGEIRRVITESIVPFFRNKLESKNLGKGFLTTGLPEDVILDPYDPFDDYLEMVIQFAYITLFAAAFPLGAAITLLFLYIEVRSDLFKLIYNCRRPLPMRANSIGVWYNVLQVIAFTAIMTNCAIVGFSSEQLSQWMPTFLHESPDHKLKYLVKSVFGAEHLLVLIAVLLQAGIQTVPSTVRNAIARREYLTKERLTREASLASLLSKVKDQ